MNIVLYTSIKDPITGKRLRDKIDMDFSCENLEIFSNMPDFIRRLHCFPRNIDVAIVLIPDDDHLSDLLQYRDVLDDIEIILILPDQNKDTVKKGMSLYPRFLAYGDSDFDDVSAVLVKLDIKHMQGNVSSGRYAL